MRITWFGHAAFLIETVTASRPVRIVTDPYSSATGYQPIDADADIVTLSHDNPKYHSHLGDIGGSSVVVDGLQLASGTREERGVLIDAVQVFEDKAGQGPNAMMRLECEGLRLLHMGDCGHPIDEAQLRQCGEIDVLLALAGGPPTIELDDLLDFCDRLKPRVVIPMHFGVPRLDLQLLPVDALVSRFAPRPVRRETSPAIEIFASSLPDTTTLRVLPHAR